MMAVFLSEWDDWYKRFASWSLGAAGIYTAVSGALSMICPEIVLEAALIGFIGFGLLAGMGIWLQVKPWDWVARVQLPPLAVVLGRILAVMVIAVIHLFFVLPVWILMGAVWGIPISLAAPLIAVFLLATVTACQLASFGAYLNHNNGVFAGLFVGGWFSLTAIIPLFRSLNPCWLIWQVLSPGYHGVLFKGALGGGVLLTLLVLIFGVILSRERRNILEDRGDSSSFGA